MTYHQYTPSAKQSEAGARVHLLRAGIFGCCLLPLLGHCFGGFLGCGHRKGHSISPTSLCSRARLTPRTLCADQCEDAVCGRNAANDAEEDLAVCIRRNDGCPWAMRAIRDVVGCVARMQRVRALSASLPQRSRCVQAQSSLPAFFSSRESSFQSFFCSSWRSV